MKDRPSSRSFPTGISSIIDTILTRKGLKKKIGLYRALEVWDDTVGAQIAANTEPVAIRRGVLEVKVSNHGWLQQLQFLKPEIVEKLNRRIGKRVVKNLFLRIGEIGKEEECRHDSAGELSKVELSEKEIGEIETLLEEVRDDGVRDSIRKTLIMDTKLRKLKASSA